MNKFVFIEVIFYLTNEEVHSFKFAELREKLVVVLFRRITVANMQLLYTTLLMVQLFYGQEERSKVGNFLECLHLVDVSERGQCTL